jgi:regulator of sirC expression with transglutaminase-like and TPR domain
MEGEPGIRLRAMVSLLGDANPQVVESARRAIQNAGESVLPILQEAMRTADARMRVRARLAYEDARLAQLCREMAALREDLASKRSALEAGCVILARSRDPRVDASNISAALDAMADDLGSRIVGMEQPRQIVEAMSRLLARELGFQGNRRNHYSPDNSYLDLVLEHRLGIPVSLSAIYLLVGRRLGLPLAGIGMPGHFILRYLGVEPGLYVDPYHGGRTLSVEDCRQYLELRSFEYHEADFEPVSDAAMLGRMIANLQLIYRNTGDEYRLRILEALKSSLRLGWRGNDTSRDRHPERGFTD